MKSAFPDPVFPDASRPRPRSGLEDGELLREFVNSRSEAAFRELVGRHGGPVLAAARRRLGGDAGLAEDAAQQTFIALARNPARAAKAPSLGAWLHRAAVFEAGNLLRGETRHRARNRLAAAVTADGSGAAAVWEAAAPHLDEALAALPETDRALLMLHHLEGRTYAETAARLGCSAAAAQRRGHRALAKLSAQLRRRGVNLPVAALAAGLGSALAPTGSSSAASVLTATLSGSLAARALSSGSASVTAGLGAAAGLGGMLGTMLSAPLLGIATLLLALAVTWALARHSQTDRLAAQETAVSTGAPGLAPNRLPGPQGPPGSDFPRRPAQPPFEMAAPDEKLTGDERAFVALAKSDTAAALAWARKKYPSQEELQSFITGGFRSSGAGRALADRDLPAADRRWKPRCLGILEFPTASFSRAWPGISMRRLPGLIPGIFPIPAVTPPRGA